MLLKCNGWGLCRQESSLRANFLHVWSPSSEWLLKMKFVMLEVSKLKPLSWCWLWQTFFFRSYILLFVFWFYASLQFTLVKLLELPRLITFRCFLYCIVERHVVFLLVVHGILDQKADCITLSVFCDMVIRKSASYVMWQSLCFSGKI